jgi:hypothetical protein
MLPSPDQAQQPARADLPNRFPKQSILRKNFQASTTPATRLTSAGILLRQFSGALNDAHQADKEGSF